MINKQEPTKQSAKPWVLAVIILATIVALLGTWQFFYHQRINKLSDASTSVWQDQATSLNGASSSSSVKAPFFWESYCIDSGPCPAVSTSWLVLSTPNQEASFIQNAFEKAGYNATVNDYKTPGASGVGARDGITMSVGFYALGPNDVIPYSSPEGKEWKSFGVTVFETK